MQKLVTETLESRIILDLANNDKHGYPPRNGGLSGLSPRLVELDRWLCMTSETRENSDAGLNWDGDGVDTEACDGSARVEITGSIVDGHGKKLGELDDLLNTAIQVWENFISTYVAT